MGCNSGCVDTDPPGGIGVLPDERMTGLVVHPDVLHELAAQIGRRGGDAAGDAVALDLGEPARPG